MKILFISLGCDKNLVDTEVMLGLLASRGYEMTDDERQEDHNVCSPSKWHRLYERIVYIRNRIFDRQ